MKSGNNSSPLKCMADLYHTFLKDFGLFGDFKMLGKSLTKQLTSSQKCTLIELILN